MIKSVMVDGVEAMKLMVDGKVAWERSGLPAGYKRCLYLESTGIQYIDTLIKDQDSDLVITSTFLLKQYNGMYNYVFGCWTDDKCNNTVCMVKPSGIWSWVNRKYNDDCNMDTINMDQVYTIRTTNSGFTINGTTISCYDSGLYRDPLNIFVFRRNGTPMQSVSIKGRIYSLQISKNGEMLLDFIPSIDATGRPCMYDTVSKQPFYNQGTGEFLYELA